VKTRFCWTGGLAILAVTALAVALASGRGRAAEAVPGTVYGEGRELCKLANQAIKESSGLACGRVNPGVFWTHNDSGDQPRLFAFNAKGEDLGAFTIAGAAARDWEDLASFKIGEQGFLLIADVGDNAEKRALYSLYLVAEPRLEAGGPAGAKRQLQCLQTINFVYEDGAHNCEAVAVDAQARVAYLVSKRAEAGCKVYSVSLAGEKNARQTAKAVAALEIPTVTAMDISADNQRAVVLTYGNAYEYVRAADETWAAAFARKGRELKMPARGQGESVCYGPDDRTLYLTSEGEPCPFLEVPVKGDPGPPVSKGPADALKKIPGEEAGK